MHGGDFIRATVVDDGEGDSCRDDGATEAWNLGDEDDESPEYCWTSRGPGKQVQNLYCPGVYFAISTGLSFVALIFVCLVFVSLIHLKNF